MQTCLSDGVLPKYHIDVVGSDLLRNIVSVEHIDPVWT